MAKNKARVDRCLQKIWNVSGSIFRKYDNVGGNVSLMYGDIGGLSLGIDMQKRRLNKRAYCGRANR